MNQVLPIDIFISKLFLHANVSPEKEIADLYFTCGSSFNHKETKFYKLRIGQKDWSSRGMGNLPDNLCTKPQYFVVPWAGKPRKPQTFISRFRRKLKFKGVLREFFDLADSIKEKGFDNSEEPIKGYLLRQGENQNRFLYTDGNRRIGILSSLVERSNSLKYSSKIHVDVRGEFLWESIMESEVVKDNILKYGFTRRDIEIWFNHVFSV